MIRSLKKLKIWSMLKKRRRPANAIQQSPHSGHRCSCSARQPPQPTAPLLLPPWAELDPAVRAIEALRAPGVAPPLDLTSILTSAAHSGAPASYQQYLLWLPYSDTACAAFNTGLAEVLPPTLLLLELQYCSVQAQKGK
ncbi:hypothetical protein C4D60_Mb04t22400 [Musa balbisiana]|uniref:Uncharacterized protein n=1 Tax=Musa balbisiana TaxID=52838 RepID=A0A4S8KDV6_MUSBA|nr:hypothetical protein C4D60_Mb04t22400 [Musa balbisiana]